MTTLHSSLLLAQNDEFLWSDCEGEPEENPSVQPGDHKPRGRGSNPGRRTAGSRLWSRTKLTMFDNM